MPGAQISKVRIADSVNGAGIPAHGGARGGATPTDVTITGSGDGDVVVEPGSQFVVHGGAGRASARRWGGPGSWPARPDGVRARSRGESVRSGRADPPARSTS